LSFQIYEPTNTHVVTVVYTNTAFGLIFYQVTATVSQLKKQAIP